MTKGFTTYTLINQQEPLRRRIACELRYQDGQLYLDRCGRLLKKLLADAAEWVLAPEPTPQGTTLHNIRNGCQFALAIGGASLTLDKTVSDEVIDPEEVEAFSEDVDELMGLVIDEFEVAKFTRLGYREQFSFSFDSKEASEKWLSGLGICTVSSSLYDAFGGTHDALGVVVILVGEECRYRIALNGYERPAQIPVGEGLLNLRASAVEKDQRKVLADILKKKRQRQINSAFGVYLDIDAFQLDPQEPDLAGFVKEQANTNLDKFRKSLPNKADKRGQS